MIQTAFRITYTIFALLIICVTAIILFLIQDSKETSSYLCKFLYRKLFFAWDLEYEEVKELIEEAELEKRIREENRK